MKELINQYAKTWPGRTDIVQLIKECSLIDYPNSTIVNARLDNENLLEPLYEYKMHLLEKEIIPFIKEPDRFTATYLVELNRCRFNKSISISLFEQIAKKEVDKLDSAHMKKIFNINEIEFLKETLNSIHKKNKSQKNYHFDILKILLKKYLKK